MNFSRKFHALSHSFYGIMQRICLQSESQKISVIAPRICSNIRTLCVYAPACVCLCGLPRSPNSYMSCDKMSYILELLDYSFRTFMPYHHVLFFIFIFMQVKNPQKDLPLGIGLALAICCILYMLVSVVIVGLVPFYELNADTPISSAFSSYGMKWAA